MLPKQKEVKVITKADIDRKRKPVVSNDDIFLKHFGCPRCGGTGIIVRPMEMLPSDYEAGYDKTPCCHYGNYRMKAERAQVHLDSINPNWVTT